MARKYKYHYYYAVMWTDRLYNGGAIHWKDGLTKKQAKKWAEFVYRKGAYRVDIVKRVFSKNRTDGVINLEEI